MKSKSKKFISILIITILEAFVINAYCQERADIIEQKFDSFSQIFLHEKIFAHTDKDFYAAGEIIWFKLYVVNATNNKPLSLSKVAYVEVLDSNNSGVLHAKITLHNGHGTGSFFVPLNTITGSYKLRAYTNWMKNFGADYFFEKNITIVNVENRLDIPALHASEKLNINFFPEGGNMVNGIPSKVAFQVTDSYGRGVNCRGHLLDDKDTILSFEPFHNGIGTFTLTPAAGHSYRAEVQCDSGAIITKSLPPAFNSGYVMNVTDDTAKVNVLVRSDVNYIQPVYLFLHTRGVKKAFLTASMRNGSAGFSIDKNLLGDGISVFTLFNEDRKPVCERLFFKKPSKELAIAGESDLTVYHTRSRISLGLEAKNTLNEDDTANISLAVYRVDSLEKTNTSYIDDYLLLSSDLKGYVEDPAWYFLNDYKQTNIALDNLMLVNGWRRFKWENILGNSKQYFEFVPEYHGVIITGTLIDKNTGKPAPGILTYLGVEAYEHGFATSVSDSNGLVKFELNDLYGPAQVIFQADNVDSDHYTFDIADPFTKSFSKKPFSSFALPRGGAPSLRDLSISMQAQNIYEEKELNHFIKPPTDTSSFYTDIDAGYLLDDYTRFTTMEEVLREYVAVVDVRRRAGHYRIILYDFPNSTMFKNDPLILIDGVPVFDVDKFMKVDPLKLYKLEVINRRYVLGSAIFDGILSWTSYNADMAGYELSDATIINYEGIQKEREFYSPTYQNEEQLSSHLPDFRNVLFWQPDINLAPGKKQTISFYSSDLPGNYKVVVQGLAKSGLPGKKIFYFQVKK